MDSSPLWLAFAVARLVAPHLLQPPLSLELAATPNNELFVSELQNTLDKNQYNWMRQEVKLSSVMGEAKSLKQELESVQQVPD
ncbi:hypothetical protein TRIUR3_28167 [Triticum urartu]|uniref:Uncharacterized protein n=1 Tax=Triticum urartu TaxID=4572 RepID=M7YMX4_TRIUA|nr:hypothetical protein TRIUR3_28167 [Triticum urartu]